MATTWGSSLIVINSVADTAGGSMRAAVNIAEAMAADGVRVTFTAPTVRGRQQRTIDLMDAGVTRHLFPATRPSARFGGSIRHLWWLARNIGSFDQVQLHSLFALSTLYTVLLCRARGVPLLLWPHGSLDPFDLRKHARLKRLIGKVATRRVLDHCSALLFTTAHESATAVTYGSSTPHEVVVLPVRPLPELAADQTAWRQRHGVPPDVPIVLFLGRIDYKKRIPLLVETLSMLHRADAQLVIVGDGAASERTLVLETADRFGVADRVHLTGWLEGDDRVAAFAAATVFALLSDAENFGLSIVEAMSVGCPVVISDGVHLAADLARAGAAVCVPRDAESAAEAIDRLIEDPQEAARIGEQARALVAREFAPAAVAARLREVSDRRAPSRTS